MIRLVATDLDGTLVPESTTKINPEVYEVIRALKERGIVFAAASGRQYESMLQVLRPVMEDVIFLAENGANVMFRGQNLSVTYIEKEAARELTAYAGTLPDCEFMIATPESAYLDPSYLQLADLLVNSYRMDAVFADDLMACADRAVKIAIYRRDGIGPVYPDIVKRFGDRLNVLIAGSVWADCVSPDIDKGRALARVQQSLGITPEETMAFGDNCNDIELLKRAGERYAVKNADPRLMAVANHIAPACEDDGVLRVIKEILLDNGPDPV